MAVLQADGTRLAEANDPGGLLGLQGLASADRERGLRRFPDGQQRLVASRTVPAFGLGVVVARDPTLSLLGWRQTAEAAALAMVLLLAVLSAAVHFAVLAARRRTEAERAAQAQLARASRLEALGTLAGGVAHDFNNVLGAIVGFGEMARDEAPEGSAQARHLDRVLQAALRGKALVERIVRFSRGGARTSTRFELEPVIAEVLTLLSASLRPGVVLERVLEAPGARVRGDPTRAFEAIMNLCTNAIQAMPAGGMVTVQAQRVQVEERRVLSHSSAEPGRYVLLTVADQGVGITPAVAEHLFEPFFTTRAAQSGTGLGLAVVHGVVAEFGGAIDVQSTPGYGARFSLYLPEALEPAEAATPAAAPASAGEGQRVLVVDDEAALVEMTGEMLEGLGYRAVLHTDPLRALECLRADPGGFDALITDEVMPRLGGTALAQAVRASAPRLPVLLVSGYGGAALAQRAAAAGVARVLAKPLQRAELAHALAQLLHEVPVLHLSSDRNAAPQA
jgi:signal transduction histidine kinase/CheY-like chemotaxis protein